MPALTWKGKSERLQFPSEGLGSVPAVGGLAAPRPILHLVREIRAGLPCEVFGHVIGLLGGQGIRSAQATHVGLHERGRVLRVNGEFTRMFGYPETETLGRTLDDLIVPPERIAESQHAGVAAATGRHAIDVTMRRRKDGSAVEVSVLCTPVTLEDGAPAIYSIYRDISGRRQAEEELRRSEEQLRELAHRLQAVREEERRRIAIEIHDELGQALTGFKLQLAWLESRLPDGSRSLRGPVRQMLGQIDRTIETVQRIGAELRPAVLDTLGPLAAFEWQAEEFARRTGIPCTVAAPASWPQIDDARSTALFRVLQEALTNVARHAQASSVRVRVAVEDGWRLLGVPSVFMDQEKKP